MMTNHTICPREGCFNKLLPIFQTPVPPALINLFVPKIGAWLPIMAWTCLTKFLVLSNGPGSVSEAVIRWQRRWWQFGQVFGGDKLCRRLRTVKAAQFKPLLID